MKNLYLILLLGLSLGFVACSDDDDNSPTLNVPTTFESANFDANVTAERTVRTELGNLTTALNDAESAAISGSTNTASIAYPTNLKSVTNSAYASEIETWLTELVKAANSGTPFDLDNAPTGEGGILGTRLLDENGLELEQVIQKGSFGAALYNHALTLMENPTEASIDGLVEIFGTSPDFNPDEATNSADYCKRRSDNNLETGFFYDAQTSLITAKAAIAAGSSFDGVRDQALEDFKSAWERSNFATVIYYCNATKELVVDANNEPDSTEKAVLLGNALHAYGEAVGFAYGWLGISDKQITDQQINSILDLLLAVPNQTPESYRFVKEASLLDNLDQIIDDIQAIYGFSESEVTGFFVNN